MSSSFEILDKVTDKDSFLEFLEALISEREEADELEKSEPEKWAYGGANGWQNSSISSFLECASCFFLEDPHRHSGEELSWKDMAEFLYYGKIYE